MTSPAEEWVVDIENAVKAFAEKYATVYEKKERELSASFEIGCFHALTDFYEQNSSLELKNLKDGKYRYLTTPSGNPDNFSYIEGVHGDTHFEIRQQVRIKSHLADDIAFTPDIVVIKINADIQGHIDQDYASGKRKFFFVNSSEVIAAHECKSTNPFPELLVSFIGMLVAAHEWVLSPTDLKNVDNQGLHLAPSLFVGGTASGVHKRMVSSMEESMPINIILGLHRGTWDLLDPENEKNRINI